MTLEIHVLTWDRHKMWQSLTKNMEILYLFKSLQVELESDVKIY